MTNLKNFYRTHRAALWVFLIVALCFSYFSSRYKIGIAYDSALPCINAKLVIIDKWQRDVPVGALATFRNFADNEFFPEGLLWTKIVAAKEGQQVRVELDEMIVDESTRYRLSLNYLLPNIEQTEEELVRTHTVESDHYFMVGETITSYDSRYWGSVPQENIIGRAYVIF